MDTSENEWLHQPFEGKACHQNEPYRLDKKDNNGQEVARKPREWVQQKTKAGIDCIINMQTLKWATLLG